MGFRQAFYLTVLTAIFIGCGGGDSGSKKSDSESNSSTEDNETVDREEKVVSIPNCTVELPTFEDLVSKDKIVPQGDDTSIQIIHSDDDKKKICTTGGEAVILRKTIITGTVID